MATFMWQPVTGVAPRVIEKPAPAPVPGCDGSKWPKSGPGHTLAGRAILGLRQQPCWLHHLPTVATVVFIRMADLNITDIESAINWWREHSPSPDGITACAEVRALATVYALMTYYHESVCDETSLSNQARDAWLAWYDTTPDAPCIAICSTSQGDDVCKGCGRTFDEVQHWPVMSPVEKRITWHRITMENTAWRFNRYAERARETKVAPPPATF